MTDYEILSLVIAVISLLIGVVALLLKLFAFVSGFQIQTQIKTSPKTGTLR